MPEPKRRPGVIKNAHLYRLSKQIPYMVNAIYTGISQFRRWISIKGLPFDSWRTNIFYYIAN